MVIKHVDLSLLTPDQGAGVADVAGDIVNDAGDDDDAEEIGMVDGDAHGLEDEDADAFSEDQEYVYFCFLYYTGLMFLLV